MPILCWLCGRPQGQRAHEDEADLKGDEPHLSAEHSFGRTGDRPGTHRCPEFKRVLRVMVDAAKDGEHHREGVQGRFLKEAALL